MDLPKHFQCLVDQTLRFSVAYRFRRCSYKKSVLKHFTGTHLCRSLLYYKTTSWRPENLVKKELWHSCCPDNLTKLSRILILWNTCKKLLLYIARIISTWRKVCLYPIYCSFIWFNYVRNIKTKEMLLIHLQIQNRIRYHF